MKSYRFSIIKTPYIIIWPWLFRNRWFNALDIIIIYPVAFVQTSNARIISKDYTYLDGMIAAIMFKQQEELIQQSVLLAILTGVIFGFSFWLVLWGLLYPLLYFADIYHNMRDLNVLYPESVRKSSTMIGYILTSSAFFSEAYVNCNYHDYLKNRKIFAWLRHYLKG